ncbi:MAG: Thiamine pyrophosphate-requiring enzymes, partial [uncultured Acetobacteraceae bacterium]
DRWEAGGARALGRQAAGGRAGGAGRDPRLLRARRELPRPAGRPLRAAQPHPARHLPLRGRRRPHGRGLRQADGQARRRHRDARPRRVPRLHRGPRRVPRLDAAGAHRRPDPLRGNGPRVLPGGGLPQDVRAARQVGDADRRRRAHPRADGARLRRGGERPPRPGGGGDFGGDAARGGRGARHRPRPGSAAAPRAGGGAGYDGDAWPGAAPARRARRRRLDRRGPRRDPRLPHCERPAGRRVLPPPRAVRRHLAQLRRRPRRRRRRGTRGQGERVRPVPRVRHPHGRA